MSLLTIEVLPFVPKLCRLDFARIKLPAYIKLRPLDKTPFHIYASYEVQEPTADECDIMRSNPRMIKIMPSERSTTFFLSFVAQGLVNIEVVVYDNDGWRNLKRGKSKPLGLEPIVKDLKNMSRKEALKSVAQLINQQ